MNENEIPHAEPQVHNIKVMADGREAIHIRSSYTEEELMVLHHDNMMKQIELKNLNMQIKELQDKKKVLTRDISSNVDLVYNGFKDMHLDAYFIDDQYDGLRKFYDEDGNFLQNRRLRPTEKKDTLKIAFNS